MMDIYAYDTDLREALAHLWNKQTRARAQWSFADALVGQDCRIRLVQAGLISEDPDFNGCWQFTDDGVVLATALVLGADDE